MNSLQHFAADRSRRDVGLVRDHDQKKTGFPQTRDRLRHARQQLKLFGRRGRAGPAIPDHRAIQHAVPVEKHRALHASERLAHSRPSHLLA